MEEVVVFVRVMLEATAALIESDQRIEIMLIESMIIAGRSKEKKRIDALAWGHY